jgi:hypothetical protein
LRDDAPLRLLPELPINGFHYSTRSHALATTGLVVSWPDIGKIWSEHAIITAA